MRCVIALHTFEFVYKYWRNSMACSFVTVFGKVFVNCELFHVRWVHELFLSTNLNSNDKTRRLYENWCTHNQVIVLLPIKLFGRYFLAQTSINCDLFEKWFAIGKWILLPLRFLINLLATTTVTLNLLTHFFILADLLWNCIVQIERLFIRFLRSFILICKSTILWLWNE